MSRLSFFNSLSRRQEDFEPIHGTQVGLYTCGPTVYHYAHIGNLRTYVFEDLLVRALRMADYQVNHVCNITDVGHLTSDGDDGDDKMEKGAAREGKTVWQIAEFYTQAFFDDLKRLNITPATHWPRATQHIPQQIAMIQTLLDKGFAYRVDDAVYYDVSKFPRYADFARKDMQGQEAGARVAPSGGKRNHQDFALWKLSPPGQQRLMEWDSPWGKGFPGWHIECSAMSIQYLGEQFDIHCGGIDHIPVHHTNEIAQTEAATGKTPWVKTWMHGEFLIMDKGKMSKSSGEFLTLQSLLDKGFAALDYRYFCLGTHYRAALTFAFEGLEGAKAGRSNLREKLAPILLANADTNDIKQHPLWLKFWDQLRDDLNSPRALAVVWDLAKDSQINLSVKRALLEAMDQWLGLGLLEPLAPLPELVLDAGSKRLLDERATARATKDWAGSDRLRLALQARGIAVKDGKDGQTWGPV